MLQLWRPLPWILGGCAAMLAAACNDANSRYLEHLHRGEHYLSAHRFEKAGVEFRNALQIAPHSAAAHYLNGQAAAGRGSPREALVSYQAAIDADPDLSAARVALADLLIKGAAADRALKVIEPGLAAHPQDPELLTVRAAARAQLKDMSGALADAQHAVAVAPGSDEAVALLAALEQRQGNAAGAVALLSQAVARRPTSVELHQALADVYLRSGETADSEAQLKAVIALAPGELSHRYRLAQLYAGSGNADAAQRVFEAAVQAFPRSNEAKLTLVDFIVRQRSRAQGESTLRGYISREPDNDDLRLGLGMLLERAGAAGEARACYDEIVRRDPRSVASVLARDHIAAIELAGGRIEEASRQLEAALQQNPRDGQALLTRAQIELQQADPAAAIVDLRALLRERPQAIDLQRMLARGYFLNGQNALAEETLRAGSESAPTDTRLPIDLAQLLDGTGRADAAVALLEQTLRRAPSDAALRAALVRAHLAKHDLAAARAAAEDLKTLQPRAAAGAYLAGLVAEQQGRMEQSQREFEHALQLEPDDLEAAAALAALQLGRGQGAAALARLRAFVDAHAGNAAALNVLGELLIAARAYAQAIEPLAQAVQLSPAWPLPHRNLAAAHLANGDPAGAAAAYEAGRRYTPYEPQLVFGLAAVYERQRRIGEAIALYEDLCAHRPYLELAADNLARLLVTYRDDRRSLDRAAQLTAAFANSDSARLLDTNGWVRLKLGDTAAALSTLERAMLRAPDSREIRYHLALAELRTGARDKARADLKTALAGAAGFLGSDDAQATLDRLNAGGKS